MTAKTVSLSISQARAVWLRAQRLDEAAPFGAGPAAVQAAIEHLGYVQIDTINVIERSHYHILFSRIPDYARADLAQLQAQDKSIFEYWTHALAYVPSADYRFFMPAMKRYREERRPWFQKVERKDYLALLKRIRDDGALSIRDIEEEPVEKEHLWDSRKPSKRAMRMGFYIGDLTIARRAGMLKTYELTDRHFGWETRPKPATERQVAAYTLARALKAQGIVSLDSICYGNLGTKPTVKALIDAAVKRKALVSVEIEGSDKLQHWADPAVLDAETALDPGRIHILSPFDPLIIQRKRLALMFGYEHRFEAYVPQEKRVLGYFALPVLAGDEIVAALDLKTDRQGRRLLVQKWTWIKPERPALKRDIEAALGRFERFQLA